jgi:glycosyltransferase involved in cell wall biosynthesis
MSTVQAEARPAAPTSVLPSLSIVLPCFDEAPNVAAAVAEARAAAERFAERHEVIVVDDGSTDGTREIAVALAAGDPGVRVIVHEHNRGYGAAVRSGIAASRSAWVLLTDGDLQFDLAELERFLPSVADHELVAGYRLDRADPLPRRLAAHAWNRLMRRSFGVSVRDVDCAFKLMRGDAARALALESDGAMVSTELLVRAGLAGWRIDEVGVHHRPRRAGDPTGGDPRVILRAFRERRALMRRLRRESPNTRRPLRREPQPTAT